MITKFLIDIIIALLLTFIIFVGIGVVDIVFIYNKNSKKKKIILFRLLYTSLLPQGVNFDIHKYGLALFTIKYLLILL